MRGPSSEGFGRSGATAAFRGWLVGFGWFQYVWRNRDQPLFLFTLSRVYSAKLKKRNGRQIVGFFSTSVSHIEKYKNNGDRGKLLKAVKYKRDRLVVSAALAALTEMDFVADDTRRLVRNLAQSHPSDPEIQSQLAALLNSKPKELTAALVEVFCREVVAYETIWVDSSRSRLLGNISLGGSHERIGCYRAILKLTKNRSASLLAGCLGHESAFVRIYAAGLLSDFGVHESRDRWETLLAKETLYIHAPFKSASLEQLRSNTEIALLEFDARVAAGQPVTENLIYAIGITDKSLCLSIALDHLGAGPKKGTDFTIPLELVSTISILKEQKSKSGEDNAIFKLNLAGSGANSIAREAPTKFELCWSIDRDGLERAILVLDRLESPSGMCWKVLQLKEEILFADDDRCGVYHHAS